MTPQRYRRNHARLAVEKLERRELLAVGDFLHDVADPSTVPQAGSEFGYAIAASGDLVAVGSPAYAGAGMHLQGKVHIYDRISGNLLKSIDNPSPASGDRFGEALALFGTTLVVGVKTDDAGAVDSGIAYVFNVTTGALLATLPNPTPAQFDYFGHSVAVTADTVFVGAYLDDTFGMDAGIVHAFDINTGELQYSIGSPSPGSFEYFGFDIAASGNRLAAAGHRVDSGAVDSGAVFIFNSMGGTFLRRIDNPSPADFDYFGYSIAMKGTTLAVGAYRDDTGAANAGSAYTFDVNTGAFLHSYHNPQPAQADDFGFTVALSDDSLIVGAYRDNAGAIDAGSVYQFSLATGSLIRSVPNPTPAQTDYFGAAVAAAGNSFFAGAYWDDSGALDAGAIYAYDAGSGALRYTLINPSISSFNYFGHAVAVSGDWVAIGAHLDDVSATDAGLVYVYNASTGELAATIHNPTPAAYDNFGFAVSLSGNLLAVGAHRDDAGALDSGVVHLFDVSTGTLLRTLVNPNPGTIDYFGFSVSISGAVVAVGASRDDVGATDAGMAYIFDVPSGELIASISNPDPAISDQFGYSVAIHGSRLVVGAPQSDEGAVNGGAAYVFDVATGSLLQTLQNPLTATGDYFGYSIAIHNQRVVVGAPQLGSGTGSGIVYIFDADSASLIHTLPDPQPAAFNQFGSAVSLSGKWVVVGAPGADTWGANAGRASLFDLDSGNHERQLIHPNLQVGDLFGTSVAVGYEYIVVGAPQVDGVTTDRGAISLFEARVNAAPDANPGGPYLGLEGASLQLDASASSDDRDLPSELTFEWDLNYDGVVFQVDAIGMTADVVFENNFPVRQIAVRVTDTEGLSSIAATSLQIDNVAPTVTVVQPAVTVPEGSVASNTGTFSDPGDDIVQLSSSVGSIVDNGDGSWSWSYPTTDGPNNSTTVTITGTDNDGADHIVAFQLIVENVAPSVAVNQGTVSVQEGHSASMSGTYFDLGDDTVALSSSIGTIVNNGDGTWNWTLAVADLSVTVIITAMDEDGGEQTTSFNLLVTNLPPLVEVDAASITANEGTEASNSGTYFDPGIDLVELECSIGYVVDEGDGTWSWSMDELDGPEDTSVVEITVTDASGMQSTVTFDLTVVNMAPIVSVDTTTVSVLEGTLATNTGTILDPGGDPVILASSAGSIIDAGNGTWSWTLETTDGPNNSTVTITATDEDGAVEVITFELIVENAAPNLAPTSTQVTVGEGETATNTGTVVDPGGDNIVLLTSSIGTMINNGDGTWSWSMDTSDGPDNSVTVTVFATDDEGAQGTSTFELSVVNVPPALTVTEDTVAVSEGQPATNTGSYFDPGADLVSISSSIGNIVNNGDGTWNWSLDVADVPATVTITGTDEDGAEQFITFDLVVANTPPTIAVAEPVVSVQEGGSASNSGTYFDPGIDAVVLTSSIGNVVDNGDGTWSWSLDSSDVSSTVTVTVTDGHGTESSVLFELVVSNTAPTVSVDQSVITVEEGTAASNTGTYFDPGIDAISLTSSVGTVTDNGDGTWSWLLDGLDGPADSGIVQITVTDASGIESQVTFALNVLNVSPNVAADFPQVTIQGGETATMTGTFGDPGGDVVLLTSSVGTIVDNGNGTWSWSWATADGPDDSTTVTITATDDDGAQQVTIFQVVDHDLAEILQIVVGDGTDQRSMVTRVEVHFDTEVDIDPTAFVIVRTGDNGGTVETQFTTAVVDGRTVATITFSGALSEITGSLVDGKYQLTIDGEQIRRAGTTSTLDADGDGVAGGVRIFGETPTDRFFRLFGDVDGDYDVDSLDRAAFLQSFGSIAGNPDFDARFDADGDGDVDHEDRLRFLQNFRRFPVVNQNAM